MLLSTVENIIKVIKRNIAKSLLLKADLESPTLTGIPTAPTANKNTNTNQIATTAFVVSEIDDSLKTSQSLIYKGTVSRPEDLPEIHSVGWTYVVKVAGTYAGEHCEIGDMIICKVSGTTSNDEDWFVIHTSQAGTVTGPTSSVDNNIALFSGETGRVLKDGLIKSSELVLNNKYNTVTNMFSLKNKASLTLNSNDSVSYFELASGESPDYIFKGSSDGFLSWNNHSIPLTVNGKYPDSKGNINIDVQSYDLNIFSENTKGLVPGYSSSQVGYVLSTAGWVEFSGGSGDTELISVETLAEWYANA